MMMMLMMLISDSETVALPPPPPHLSTLLKHVVSKLNRQIEVDDELKPFAHPTSQHRSTSFNKIERMWEQMLKPFSGGLKTPYFCFEGGSGRVGNT